MIPPSFTRSSATDWMKHACGWGRAYAEVDSTTVFVFGSTCWWPCAGPSMPYAQCRPVLNHCGEFGAHIWFAIMNRISS